MVISIFALIGLGSTAAAAEGRRLGVFVSILPQQDFLSRMGGDLVDVQVMVPPGASPHTYEPKPRQMKAITQTQLYFAIGVPFEKAWLPRISATNPQMKIIHTDRGIEKMPMAAEHEHGQTPSDHSEHSDHRDHRDQGRASGNDPHIWLSPPLVHLMAGHILNALIKADPDHEAIYRRNYQQFSDQIKALDTELHQIMGPFKGTRFMVFHPSWGYFARTYDLIQIPIEVQGKAPKPAGLQQLIQRARTLEIKTVLVQPQFSQKSAAIIADAINGGIVTADPMAEAWAENLRRLGQQLQTIVR